MANDEDDEPDLDIDHEYTSEVVCPWCGHEQTDIWEFEGIYEEGSPVRIDCQACERPFDSTCSVSYSFSTRRPDLQAEQREKEERQREVAERLAICRRYPPGTRIRVEGDKCAAHIRGRVGVVANREINKHNPFVYATLDPVERDGTLLPAYDVSIWPCNVALE